MSRAEDAGRTQLMMRRADLAGLPDPHVPPGYAVRRAGAADAAGIAAVMAGAFAPGDGAPGSAAAVMDRLMLAPNVRSVFVCVAPDGAVASTASAVFDPGRYGDVGYVHWVATDPVHSRRGLGSAVTLAVLNEFASWGLVAAVLETDDHRIPAVRAYLRLGFQPFQYRRDHPGRWAAVMAEVRSST